MTMRSVAVSIFKAQCLSLLENVARTGRPLLITKRGKPLARVTPGEHSRASSPQGTLRGTVETLGDLLSRWLYGTSDSRIVDSRLVRTIS